MRRLIENRTAALRGVEFFRAARAVEIVGVVQRRDHAHRAVCAARDQFARAQNRRIEGMAMADDQVNAGLTRRIGHGGAILERERHRLFDQHVLAMLGSENRVARVMLMRRRDVNDLDRRIGAKVFDRFVGPGRKILRKAAARLCARVSRGDQLDARIAKRRQHHAERTPQTRNADAQSSHGSPNSTRPRVLIRLTS